jgi:hypothetical protein
MDDVLAAEAQLRRLQWLLRRPRSYLLNCASPPDVVLESIRSSLSGDLKGTLIRSSGVGRPTLAGKVWGNQFQVRWYSPSEVNSLGPPSYVTLRGEVEDSSPGASVTRIGVFPSWQGLVVWLVGSLIGLAVGIFGVVQFATQSHWASFGIAIGIATALLLGSGMLLVLSVSEGRRNEVELIRQIRSCVTGHTGVELPGQQRHQAGVRGHLCDVRSLTDCGAA